MYHLWDGGVVLKSFLMGLSLVLVATACGSDSDPGDSNCGNCTYLNGEGGCVLGQCTLLNCDDGFYDLNEEASDGCEYACAPAEPGEERCDLEDNDCDGRIDEGYRLLSDLNNCGACGEVCEGAQGTPVCLEGRCRMQDCEAGFMDCDTEVSGCETDRLDLDHCLSCGHACAYDNGVAVCDETEGCQLDRCLEGYVDLDSDWDNGCEYGCAPQEPGSERCDGEDNNCDGVIDEGFDLMTDLAHCGGCDSLCAPVNAVAACRLGQCLSLGCRDGFESCDEGVFGCETSINTLEHCGACNQACAFPNGTASCREGECLLASCDDGFFDVNGAWQDGCEYNCVVEAGPDLPDAEAVDSNCDGIDGDVGDAVFVSPSGLDNPQCSLVSPCRSIGHAIGRAQSLGRHQVLVQVGRYEEAIQLVDGLHVVGGYGADFSRAGEGHTEILASVHAGRQRVLGILAQGVTAHVSDLHVLGRSAQQPGESSQLVLVEEGHLRFSRVVFRQGHGADGTEGQGGADASGQAAPAGGRGGDGVRHGRSCDDSSKGRGGDPGQGECGAVTGSGGGGSGGTMDSSCNCVWGACTCALSQCDARGGRGGANAHLQGAGYGRGGSGAGTCRGGDSGEPGRVRNGPGGRAGHAAGRLGDGRWLASQGGNGGLGEHGSGGGGGGGAGGCDNGTDSFGGGGGGGGAGGCRALSGGGGGQGGGGSFAIISVRAQLEILASRFERGVGGRGGPGGRGGRGQPGGAGGSGGSGTGNTGPGGGGGDGAHGGHGGGGAGGNGGHSVGILRLGGDLNMTDCEIVGGQPGGGGVGGRSAPHAQPGDRDGNDGQGGATGLHGDVLVCQAEGGC